MIPPNFQDFVDRYLAGETPQELARELGIHYTTFNYRLRKLGVKIRGRAEAAISRRADLPVKEVICRFKSGELMKDIAKSFGYSLEAVRELLRREGIPLRDRSEVASAIWERMAPEEKERRGEELHSYICGRKYTLEERFRRAERCAGKGRKVSPDEGRLKSALEDLGYVLKTQVAVGYYHVDLALDGCPIAVEVERNSWMSGKPVAGFRERLKYILDQGWTVLFVCGTDFDFPSVAQDVGVFLDFARTHKTTRGKYGVISSTAKLRSSRSVKFDGFPRVEGF